MEKTLSAQRKKLQEIEQVIRESIATGRKAIRQVGVALAEIQGEELWRLSEKEHKDFYGYAYDAFGLERWNVNYAINAERAFHYLEQASLKPPLNDTQAAVLGKLDADRQPRVWKRIIEQCEKQDLDITVSRVRDAVQQEQENGKKGIQVDLSDEEGEGELLLTEEGEEALARIKALCGGAVEQAIRQQKNAKVTEDAIKKWASQSDETVEALPYYVFGQSWTVRKALNYLSQIIEADTEVDELVLMARNRGGHFSGRYQDARIIVDIPKID